MNFTDEWFLQTKLRARGLKCDAFGGATDHEQRREKIRAAIKVAGIATTECWVVKGKAQTFAEAFAQTFGEAL